MVLRLVPPRVALCCLARAPETHTTQWQQVYLFMPRPFGFVLHITFLPTTLLVPFVGNELAAATTKAMIRPYFTDFTYSKAVFYVVVVLFVVSVGLVSLSEPLMQLPCEAGKTNATTLEFSNSLYQYSPCRFKRYPKLLFLTPDECSFGRRLVAAVVLGGVIGWERREADRPAGIRTMSLVSLGSSLFTINSAFAFLDGPMSWDASRISAAIPSGVGFLVRFDCGRRNSKSAD